MVAFLHLHFAGDKLGHKRIWPCIWPVMELVFETQSSDHKLPSRRYTLPSHECCRFKRRRRAIPGSCGWQQEAEAWLRPPETDRQTPRAQGPQRHLFILFLKLHHKQKEIQDCNTSSLQNDSETFARSVSCLGASRCGQCSSDQVHLQGTCLQRAMSSYKAERTKFR